MAWQPMKSSPSASRVLMAAAAIVAAAAIIAAAARGLGHGSLFGRSSGRADTALPISAAEVRGALERYCTDCHNDAEYTANLSLEAVDLSSIAEHAPVWEDIVRKLRSGLMPPPGQTRPDFPLYGAITAWIESEIDRHATPNPGTKVLHRLNRVEYANAIRDLLDLEIDPVMYLPPDDSSRGFDNIAGSLTISPTLIESYASAAAKIARIAVGYWRTPTEATYINRTDVSQAYQLEGLPFGTRGGMVFDHVFPAEGDYTFTIRNLDVGSFIPDEVLEFSIDNERVHVWPFTLNRVVGMNGEGFLEVTLPVAAGSHRVAATFIATNYRPSLDIARHFDRKSLENGVIRELSNYPVLGAMIIQGPFNAKRPSDSPSMRRVFTCQPGNASEEEPCAREILSTLASRAFRRPVAASDVEVLMAFFEEGRTNGTFADGIELALRRLLASPQFLTRVEREPPEAAPGATYRISDIELASRLSFFLWSSIPDDELITLASVGELGRPEVLEAQVRRMLADPRAASLVDNFAEQWLYLRNLATTAPAQTVYPDWDDELRQGFARETKLLFETIMREDRNVLEFLTADYTFVNERLARHYGIPNVYGAHFRRVVLGPELDYRRGVLGHGSFLATTWVQNHRTSPVKRGVWVLENILGVPPPEPLPNAPALEDTGAAGGAGQPTLREQMTRHRADEPCASCHAIMDPIGFALENFGADAKWRTHEHSVPIDTHVELYDGTPIGGPADLRNALLRYSPQFLGMFTEKLMTYGLGRGVEYYDMPVVRQIVRDAAAEGYRFSAIVLGIVDSAPFQLRTKAP